MTTAHNHRLDRALAWVQNGALAVTDQGLISGSNFVLNVLLARWITPEQYGVFALANSFLVLALSVYQSLVLEPMPVVAIDYPGPAQRVYFGALLNAQTILALIAAVCFATAGLVSMALHSNAAMTGALFGLALAVPATLLLYYARCACYVTLQASRATQGALLYTCLLFASTWFLYSRALLSGFSAFIAISIAALSVGLYLTLRLTPDFRPGYPQVRQVCARHWNFGRWELSRSGFDWLSENISLAATAPLLGLARVGELKAIMTLFLPLVHLLTALRRLVLPRLAMTSRDESAEVVRQSVGNLNLIYLAFAAVYAVLLCLFRDPILRFAYGDRYAGASALVPLVSIALAFGVPANGFDIGLRALRAPRMIFFGSAAAATAAGIFVIPAVKMFGLYGSIGTILLSSLVSCITLRAAFLRQVATNAHRSAQSGGLEEADHAVRPAEEMPAPAWE